MGKLSKVHIYIYAKTIGMNYNCLGQFWKI